MDTAPPPPGWYPDPERPGARRWWNGQSWARHVADGPAVAAPVAAGEGASRTWAMAAHLSALGAAFVAMAFLGPLVVYLVKRDEDAFVRAHAAEALNFQLSALLYAVVGGIVLAALIVLVVGIVLIPLAVAAALAWLALTIVAGVRAGQGRPYRYPLTIRFVH